MVKRIRNMLTETNNSNHLKQFELLCNLAFRVLSHEVKMFDSKISILLGILLGHVRKCVMRSIIFWTIYL